MGKGEMERVEGRRTELWLENSDDMWITPMMPHKLGMRIWTITFG